MTLFRHRKHKRSVKRDLWLVPYADMMTLLFALFVILHSVSSIEARKFEALQESLWHAFIGGASRSEISQGGYTVGAGQQRGDIIDGIQLVNRQDGPMRAFLMEKLPDAFEEEIGRSLEIVMDDDTLAVIAPINAYFEEGSAQLTSKARSKLAELVGGLRGHAGRVRFVVEYPEEHSSADRRAQLCSRRLDTIWNLVKYLPSIEIYGHHRTVIAKEASPRNWEQDTTLTLAFSNL